MLELPKTLEDLVALMGESYERGYTGGYLNGHHDAEAGETEFGIDSGDSFEIWMVERQGGAHPSDMPFGAEPGHCRAYRGASCIAWAREGACPHVPEDQWLRRTPEDGEWTSRESL